MGKKTTRTITVRAAVKRPRRWLLWVSAALGLAIAAIIMSPPDHATSVSVPSASRRLALIVETSSGLLVPAPDRKFNYEGRYVKGVPRVLPPQLLAALHLIVEMEQAPDLQTPDDHALMRLAKSLENGSRVFRIGVGVVTAGDGKIGSMAYSCVTDRYVVHPEIRTTTPLLAVSLYHEIKHATECQEEIVRTGITDPQALPSSRSYDPCRDEPSAWAAGIRFFFALEQAGKLPTELSVEETSDAGLIEMLNDTWNAILEDRFCAFYRARAAPANQ